MRIFRWDGTAWEEKSGWGLAEGGESQSDPRLTFIGSTPYVGWVAKNTSGKKEAVLYRFREEKWEGVTPPEPINTHADIGGFDLATSSSMPYLATQEVDASGTGQIYVQHLDEGEWIADGDRISEGGLTATGPVLRLIASKVYLAYLQGDSESSVGETRYQPVVRRGD
jgi:hypothetical protein